MELKCHLKKKETINENYYLYILVIFTSLSIVFSNKIFLELLPIIIWISIEHVRDYASIYEKYFKQKYSLFKLYLNVSTIPTILFAIFSSARYTLFLYT